MPGIWDDYVRLYNLLTSSKELNRGKRADMLAAIRELIEGSSELSKRTAGKYTEELLVVDGLIEQMVKKAMCEHSFSKAVWGPASDPKDAERGVVECSNCKTVMHRDTVKEYYDLELPIPAALPAEKAPGVAN